MFDNNFSQPVSGTEVLLPSGKARVTLHLVRDGFRWQRNNGDWVSLVFPTAESAQRFARAEGFDFEEVVP